MQDNISSLVKQFPVLANIQAYRPILWQNPDIQTWQPEKCPITMDDILSAAARLERFAPYIAEQFPETVGKGGVIESPLIELTKIGKVLLRDDVTHIKGKLMLKCDNDLPVAGSVKARGGIYAVLKYAEDLAISSGLIRNECDYTQFKEPPFRKLFQSHHIMVGSTGNLGLSIGIISAALGFRVTVHMSADAKQWKKDLLRSKGVEVKEYTRDFSYAVSQGRLLSQRDPLCYFIDDENSVELFLGYAVAALRLKKQLDSCGISVDEKHPLYLYLPCGVGGGPGGILTGMKHIYGNNVHACIAEPTHSPCMTIGLITGKHSALCVQDLGLDGRTCADGLAVGRPSSFVGRIIRPYVDLCCTVKDSELYSLLALLYSEEHILLEPSALAGLAAFSSVIQQKQRDIEEGATHIIWATGGAMVPDDERKKNVAMGRVFLQQSDQKPWGEQTT